MGKLGCGVDGNLNEAKFSEPMPWIGLYIAAASLACAVAMAADLIRGSRQQKLWFPSKFSSINATSLTIIAVAVKLSVDLNAAMPRRVDQLAKLSSGTLLCTVMGNSMPSLGTMDNNDLCTNIIALGILVVTVIVNTGVELGTGVIYLYWKEHALIMFLMLVLLVILCSSALTVPVNNKYFQYKYNKKYDMTLKEDSNETRKRGDKELKEDLMKFWMMAHTCSPQFVVGRSVTCEAAGALCLLGAMILAQAMLRSYLMPWSFKFCTGESDYKWSTILVLIAQTIAVGAGTIGPAIRWFNADRFCKKFAHDVKYKLLDLCIGMQTGIVLGSKVIQFISVYFMIWIFSFCDFCKKLKTIMPNNGISSDSRSESQSTPKPDLSRYVMHLEGEEELVELMMKSNFDATDHWLRRGERKQPKHFTELLEKSTFADGFKGVREFDSDLVLSLGCEPPNCWALPVVTLTAIAVALPNVSAQRKCSRGVLMLQRTGLRSLREAHMNQYEIESPSKWPLNVLAVNSLYKITQIILQNHEGRNNLMGEILFEVLSVMISDILGACLTNLKHVL
ncbi:Transmembrane protein [Salix suchowensis]|nr:Transmembrane protein [Salix suchowensis]